MYFKTKAPGFFIQRLLIFLCGASSYLQEISPLPFFIKAVLFYSYRHRLARMRAEIAQTYRRNISRRIGWCNVSSTIA